MNKDWRAISALASLFLGIGKEAKMCEPSKTMQQSEKPELNEVEKQEPYARYYERASAVIPLAVLSEIESSPKSSDDALTFARINNLLNPGYLAIENGYCTMPRETGYEMAMHCAQEYNNLAAMLPELFDTYAE